MKTIPAREIKRRGIGAVDGALQEGPVHVIKRDELSYVILSEDQYRELLQAHEGASQARGKALEELSHFTSTRNYVEQLNLAR